jgi:formamidopyrimidine-DNA glycosylase
MPELPDIAVYIDGLNERIRGRVLERIRLVSPFLLRSVDPPILEAQDREVREIRRLGKRIVLALSDDLFLVIHLMIAGRLRWERRGAKPPGKVGLAAFDFPTGTLVMTEASAKKRASLYLARGEAALSEHDPRGLEVLEADLTHFGDVLRRENHTLKRALTDPRLFSGIGNAYSDEILHAARLSPVTLTRKLSDDEVERLYLSTREVLQCWTNRLREQFRDRFPGAGDITAFRDGFAVHGRYRKPCPTCGHDVQRIRYADNETNYCPVCQTGGRLLADRSLSRLLKDDWPRSIEELEQQLGRTPRAPR